MSKKPCDWIFFCNGINVLLVPFCYRMKTSLLVRKSRSRKKIQTFYSFVIWCLWRLLNWVGVNCYFFKGMFPWHIFLSKKICGRNLRVPPRISAAYFTLYFAVGVPTFNRANPCPGYPMCLLCGKCFNKRRIIYLFYYATQISLQRVFLLKSMAL